jgi:hypothetical protein
MTQRQRDLLNRLLEVINTQKDFSFRLDDESMTQAIKMAKSYKVISKVLYHILCDHPNNEDREYDVEQANEFIYKLQKMFE